jgi:hypothetical protein
MKHKGFCSIPENIPGEQVVFVKERNIIQIEV